MTDEMICELVDATEEWSPQSDGGANTSPQPLAIGSDIEIARCVGEDLRSRYGDIIVCEGSFWRYAGTHWRSIPEHELRLATQDYDGSHYGEHGTVRLGKTRVDSIIHEMGAMLTDPNFFISPPTGINCASGFIRFAADGSPSLEPHDPEHRCRHVLKGRWNGGINGDELELHVRFSLLGRLVYGVFEGDADADQKVALLQEIAGAVALAYGTKLREPKAVILKGETAENGKSQILDVFRSLLPTDAIASIPAGRMGDERYIPQLVGKHLNAADELSGANAIASDIFKAIVTGEPVTGRDVYRSAVTFRPAAQHVFCTNTLPSFAGGMDRGVQRRLLVIPFNRVIPREERVEHIGLRIGEEEPDRLLAWAVEGASRLIPQRGFTVPASSEAALREWLTSADPVLAWISAGGVTVVDPKSPEWKMARIKSKDAYSFFKNFAVAEGFRENTLPAANGFVQRLTANRPTIEIKHTNTGNWLTGIRIDSVNFESDEASFGIGSEPL